MVDTAVMAMVAIVIVITMGTTAMLVLALTSTTGRQVALQAMELAGLDRLLARLFQQPLVPQHRVPRMLAFHPAVLLVSLLVQR